MAVGAAIVALTVPRVRKVALAVLAVLGGLIGLRALTFPRGGKALPKPDTKKERARVRDEEKAVNEVREKAEDAAPDHTTPPDIDELVERANRRMESRDDDA